MEAVESDPFFEKYEFVIGYKGHRMTKKTFLGQSKPRKCRYCERGEEDGVTFRKIAHSLPELIGNKWIYSLDECDRCNEHFSEHLENHFANFLGLSRTLSQVKGKKGVPQTGRSHDSHVKASPDGLKLVQKHEGELFELDLEKKELRVNFHSQPYVPSGVYKAFLKMAFAIMPEENRRHYSHLRRWLISDSYLASDLGYRPLFVQRLFMPGTVPVEGVRALLFRCKSKKICVPGFLFVLAFNNFSFQVPLPQFPIEKDSDEYVVPFFPIHLMADGCIGTPEFKSLNLTDHESASHPQEVKMRFSSYEENDSST